MFQFLLLGVVVVPLLRQGGLVRDVMERESVVKK